MGLPDPRAQPFRTVAEVASDLGWDRRAVHKAIALGELPAVKVGVTRVPTAALWRLAGLEPPEPPADSGRVDDGYEATP